MIGERCKTYTGMPIVGTYRRRSGLDVQTLQRQANDNLVALPAMLRAEYQRREQVRLEKLAERMYRAQLRADIKAAKADVRRVRCTCKDCKRYSRTVTAWIISMQDILKEKAK